MDSFIASVSPDASAHENADFLIKLSLSLAHNQTSPNLIKTHAVISLAAQEKFMTMIYVHY